LCVWHDWQCQRFSRFPDANIDTNTHIDADCDSNGNSDRNANGDSNYNGNAEWDTNSYSECYWHCNADPYAKRNST
jgi:hypothetical protein